MSACAGAVLAPAMPMMQELAERGVERPSGSVTFLFTDIESSTRRWEEYPDEMCEAVATHDAILRSAFDRHGGYVFATTGDGFAVAFWSVADATRAACEAQGHLDAHPWPTPRLVHVRMGIHVGEADERNGNYYGRSVNRAARVMAAGHGSQILLSAAAAASVANDGQLVDLGEHRLKDLVSPERLYQLGLDEFPALRTLAVARHDSVSGASARAAQALELVGHMDAAGFEGQHSVWTSPEVSRSPGDERAEIELYWHELG